MWGLVYFEMECNIFKNCLIIKRTKSVKRVYAQPPPPRALILALVLALKANLSLFLTQALNIFSLNLKRRADSSLHFPIKFAFNFTLLIQSDRYTLLLSNSSLPTATFTISFPTPSSPCSIL